MCRPSRPMPPATGPTCGTGMALDAADREDLLEDHPDLGGDRRRRDADACRGDRGLDRVVGEQLVVEGEHLRQRRQQPRAGLVGALREGEEPPTGVVAVVGHLLDPLGRRWPRARGHARWPAAPAAPAARSRTAAAARSSRRSRRCPARRGARCGTRSRSRKKARASSGGTGESAGITGTHDGEAAAARASSSRAWPSRSSAMLASAMSSSRSGARLHHSESRWE